MWLLPPPSISPIAAPSEEQKEHEDDKNKVHVFLQNILRKFLLADVGRGSPSTSLGFYLLTFSCR